MNKAIKLSVSAAALAAAFFLGACGDDDEPVYDSPTADVSTYPTSSVGPGVPYPSLSVSVSPSLSKSVSVSPSVSVSASPVDDEDAVDNDDNGPGNRNKPGN